MQRHATVSFLSIAALLCGLGHLVGCAAPPEDALSAERAAALAACHLDDGTVDHDADLRACDPQNKKKTTICHIPPGNPANAHTLCVGNAAVPAHVRNHGDLVGACANETPCPPPPGGTGGAPVTAGTGGAESVGGTGGAGPVIVP
jgi:hypothetical protein